MPDARLQAARSRACVQLAALADHELHLVETDELDELEGVHDGRLRLLAVLEGPGSGSLPDADKTVLQRAMRTQLLTGEAMRQRRDRLAAQLSHNGQARRAAAGYAASTGI